MTNEELADALDTSLRNPSSYRQYNAGRAAIREAARRLREEAARRLREPEGERIEGAVVSDYFNARRNRQITLVSPSWKEAMRPATLIIQHRTERPISSKPREENDAIT